MGEIHLELPKYLAGALAGLARDCGMTLECLIEEILRNYVESRSTNRPRLQAVKPRPGARLELTFASGHYFDLDMSDVIEVSPGLKPLSNEGAFEGVTLGDGGWTIEWPALDIQIGADTLLQDALAQTAR